MIVSREIGDFEVKLRILYFVEYFAKFQVRRIAKLRSRGSLYSPRWFYRDYRCKIRTAESRRNLLFVNFSDNLYRVVLDSFNLKNCPIGWSLSRNRPCRNSVLYYHLKFTSWSISKGTTYKGFKISQWDFKMNCLFFFKTKRIARFKVNSLTYTTSVSQVCK